jgi:hypothetical protein
MQGNGMDSEELRMGDKQEYVDYVMKVTGREEYVMHKD